MQAEYAGERARPDGADTHVRRTSKGVPEVRTRTMPDGGLVRTFTDVTDYVGTLEALRQSEGAGAA